MSLQITAIGSVMLLFDLPINFVQHVEYTKNPGSMFVLVGGKLFLHYFSFVTSISMAKRNETLFTNNH
jgi:hypothetical protein